MEKIPDEIWEIIFEPILIECPRKLLQMRTVSKFFRAIVDEYISRPQLWFKACKRIPHHILDTIVRTKFPRNAWPWQENYWKESKSATMPRTIYLIWKNPNPQSNSTRINKLSLPDNQINVRSWAINDKYLALLSSDYFPPNETDIYIYSLSNIQQCISQYQIDRCERIDFYSTKNREFLLFEVFIDSEKIENVFLAEFLVDDEIRESNLMDSRFPLDPLNRYIIVANECFTIFGCTVKHHIFDQTCFRTSAEFSLLPGYSIITNIKIVGSELQVVTRKGNISEIMWAHRYHISREANGTLSFTQMNLWETIHTEHNIEQDVLMALENNICYDSVYTRNLYMSAETTSRMGKDFCNRTIIFDDELTMIFSSIFKWTFNTALVHGNLFFVGTSDDNETRIMIFKWDCPEFMDALMAERLPRLWTETIDLDSSPANISVNKIHITYIGSKLTMIVETCDAIFTVVFMPQD